MLLTPTHDGEPKCLHRKEKLKKKSRKKVMENRDGSRMQQMIREYGVSKRGLIDDTQVPRLGMKLKSRHMVALANYSGSAASSRGIWLLKSSIQARAAIELPKTDTSYTLADDVLTYR